MVSAMERKPRIQACPNCGSAELEWITGGASAIFDVVGATTHSGIMHCNSCGNDVLPVEFDSEETRREFAKSLKERPAEAEGVPEAAPKEEAKGINIAGGYAKMVMPLGALAALVLGTWAIYTGEAVCGAACFLAAIVAIILWGRA